MGTEVQGKLRFRLERYLGGGSFGSVYSAAVIERMPSHPTPSRVAIKLLHGALADKQRRHTLQRELSALLAINNDRIPRVYDWKLDGDQPFIAMEFFPHGTLSDMLDRVGAIDEGEAMTLLERLLEALVAAHGASVLHLDIKPANVLLDGDGGFVLTDFGVAQAPRSGKALPMAGLGSPGWHAPEQEERLRGTFDLRTDLFGVGTTVWSALTGVNLSSEIGMLRRRRWAGRRTALPPIRKLRQCMPELETIVMSLVARNQDDRPGNAAIVLDRIRRLRRGDHTERAVPGREIKADELRDLVQKVVDPLVAQMFRRDHRGIRYLDEGEQLCQQGDSSLHAFALVHGAIRVVRDGVTLARIDREGEFVGEIAALTGEKRSASLIADGPLWVRVLDAAQLESVIATNPALGVRLIRSMASRFKYTK